MARKLSLLIRVGVIGLVCFSGVSFILFYQGHLNGPLPGACVSLSLSSGFTLPRKVEMRPDLKLEFRVSRNNPNILLVTAASEPDAWDSSLQANEYYAFQSNPLSRPYRVAENMWRSGLSVQQTAAPGPDGVEPISTDYFNHPIGVKWPGEFLTDNRPSISLDRTQVAFISYTL